MSFKDCILEAGKQGLINKTKQGSLTDDFDDLRKNYQKKGMSLADAERQAGLDLFNKMNIEAAEKIKVKKLTLQAQQKFEFRLNQYLEEVGDKANIQDFLESYTHEITLPQNIIRNISVEEQIKNIEGIFDKHMAKILRNFERNVFGVNKNKASLEAIGREIYSPGSTGNKAAQEFARAWIDTSELARRMYNNAGGRIPYNKNWHLPQGHNMYLVRSFGKKNWVNYMLNEGIIDADNMINYQTGKVFEPNELRTALENVWESIATNGRSKEGTVRSSMSLANKRIDHRFIKFQDFDSWQRYMKKFGNEMNVFDLMVSHLKSMARDIATMQVLTPHPERMIQWMTETLNKKIYTDFKLQGKQLEKVEKQIRKAKKNMEIGMHLINGGHNKTDHEFLMKIGSGIREMTTAAYLGSAFFLATGDLNTTRWGAKYIGLPQWKTLSGNMKMFAEGIKTDSRLIKTAMTSGLTAEMATSVASAAARVNVGETGSPLITKRISDFVLRTSGLSWWTQAGKWGAGMEMMGYMANISDLSWKQLSEANPDFHNFLRTFQITSDDWNKFRSIEKHNFDNPNFPDAEFLRPGDILDSNLPEAEAMEIYSKFQSAVNNFLSIGIPEAKIKGQLFLGYSEAGTIGGEIKRSMIQFKQFPLTFYYQHIKRVIGMSSNKDKFLMGSDLLLSTTLMGALAFEMKQVIKGKRTTSFEDMDKRQAAAYIVDKMLHGGGLGFIGDLIQSAKYGSEIPSGASLGLIFDGLNLTAGSALRALDGKDPNVRGQVFELIKKNFPGSSLWYARLALERLGFDWLQEQIDPKYPQKRKRLNKRAKDQNTEYWWSPGERTPEMLPF